MILAQAAAPVVTQAQILVAIQALTPAGYFENTLILMFIQFCSSKTWQLHEDQVLLETSTISILSVGVKLEGRNQFLTPRENIKTV